MDKEFNEMIKKIKEDNKKKNEEIQKKKEKNGLMGNEWDNIVVR